MWHIGWSHVSHTSCDTYDFFTCDTYDSFICLLCHIWWSHVSYTSCDTYDSFICDTYDSFICPRIRFLHVSHMMYMRHTVFTCWRRLSFFYKKRNASGFVGQGWQEPFLCVTWLIPVCDMTHSCVWHDAFMCVTWCIHVCDMTHSCVWHDAFMCVTWLIHVCDMMHSCLSYDSRMKDTTWNKTS